MTTPTYAFVYGTLRPGGTLDDLMPGMAVATGTLPGRLHRHRAARFPVFVDDTDPASIASHGAAVPVVTGTIFAIDPSELRRLDFVTDMEVGAGYDVRFRRVRVSDPVKGSDLNPGDYVTAMLFAWAERQGVGPIISTGDWFSPAAVATCTDLRNDAGFTTRSAR